VAINYTTKTQYLFRINKGVENHWDNGAINKFMAEASRPIPFKRMIFMGDGETDIPAMKMVTYQGGQSIAVYDEQCEEKDLDKIHSPISDGRVDFVAPGNYEEHSQMDIVVKGILGRIARELTKPLHEVRNLSSKLQGPRARCQGYYLMKRTSNKIYCKSQSGSRKTALAATQARRENTKQAKLEIARIAVLEWKPEHGDWKEFVVAKVNASLRDHISTKWVTRAVNKGVLE
jgi:hypothetical protein